MPTCPPSPLKAHTPEPPPAAVARPARNTRLHQQQHRDAMEPPPADRCAWVALVMGLDLAYVGAALVLANSLKRLSSRGDLVALVTPDVPQHARDALAAVYDAVVEVAYLQTLALQKYSGRFDDYYNYWLDKCFTKFAVFSLTQYRKVVFLDADMLAVDCPDALWECPAPAGICSAVRDIRENDRLHGNRLPKGAVEESLRNGMGRYGVRGCLLVVEPNEELYQGLRKRVEGVQSYGSLDAMVGPDEHLVTRFLADKWSHVHAKFGWVSWADREELGTDPVFLHYVSQKPWDEGEEWGDFLYWKEEAARVVKEHPQTISYFGRLIKDVGGMAGVEVTPEVLATAEEFKKVSKERRIAEKIRRDASAAALSIDLTASTASTTPHMLNSDGTWRTADSARQHASSEAKGTRKMSPPPVLSARDVSGEGKGALIVKANPNILVVHGFKRPFTSKPKEETSHSKNGECTPRGTAPQSTKPGMVPLLNLATLQTNDNDAEASGSKSGKTWMADHWRIRHGGDPDTHRSVADMDDDWRAPSARLPIDESDPAEATAGAPVPQSARAWQPPGGPGSSRAQAPPRSARLPRPQPRRDNPPSSRADQADTWRSTPRDVVDSANSWRAREESSFRASGDHYGGKGNNSGTEVQDSKPQWNSRTPRSQMSVLGPNSSRFSPRDSGHHTTPAAGPYSARYRDEGRPAIDAGPTSARYSSSPHRHLAQGNFDRRQGGANKSNGFTRFSAGGRDCDRKSRGQQQNRSAGNRGTFGNFDTTDYRDSRGGLRDARANDWTPQGSARASRTRN